jgi:hypothetical protein
MVVCLHTADGKTKSYPTIREISGGEDCPDKYITGCGRECEGWPGTWGKFYYLNCDHLDCAISLAESKAKQQDRGIFIMIILMIAIFGLHWHKFELALWFSGFFALILVYFLIIERTARRQLKELMEFRDKGSIDGVIASQIFENPRMGYS